MLIGDKIRLTRENKNLSSKYMASQLDMDLRTYEKIEHNKRELRLSEINQIAKSLGISPFEILFGEPKLVFESLTNGSASCSCNFAVARVAYEALIASLNQTIDDKDKIIELLKRGDHQKVS